MSRRFVCTFNKGPSVPCGERAMKIHFKGIGTHVQNTNFILRFSNLYSQLLAVSSNFHSPLYMCLLRCQVLNDDGLMRLVQEENYVTVHPDSDVCILTLSMSCRGFRKACRATHFLLAVMLLIITSDNIHKDILLVTMTTDAIDKKMNQFKT